MSNADFTGKGGGFLTRMASLVRGVSKQPKETTNWGDLDDSISNSSLGNSQFEVAYSKQSIKEMMERKRHNDYIRKREFDALRKIRRSEKGGLDGSLRPSFFVSSIHTALPEEERRETLKKIDAIEAQMSDILGDPPPSQPSAPRTNPAPLPAASSLPTAAANAFAKTEPLQRIPGESPSPSPSPTPTQIRAYAPTEPSPLQAKPASAPGYGTPDPLIMMDPIDFGQAPSPAPQASPPAAPQAPSAAPIATPAAAPSIKPLAPAPNIAAPSIAAPLFAELKPVEHDPDLEEAAILFANGQDDAVEAALLSHIQESGQRQSHEPTWLTLFDYYRATGQQAPFEQLTQQFAMRFHRSAPQWFSMPELLGSAFVGNQQAAERPYDWRAPSTLTMQSVATMQAVLAKVPQPWRLDWSALQHIEDDAVTALFILANGWVNQPVELHFSGIAQLDEVLKQGTQGASKESPQARWQLRLLMMRLMQRDIDFEILALDFCVLYEVSPPTWERSQNKFKSLDAEFQKAETVIGDTTFDSLYGNELASTIPPQSTLEHLVARVELSGHIHGDAADTLQLLDERRQGQNHLVIDCHKLIRIDFTSAGHILNWVIEKKNRGVRIQFDNTHYLVAALFDALGISEEVPVRVHSN